MLIGSFAMPAENPTVAMVEAAYRHHGIQARSIDCEALPALLGAPCAAKATSRDALSHWPSGALSRLKRRLGMGVLRRVRTTRHYFDKAPSSKKSGSPNQLGPEADSLATSRAGKTGKSSPIALSLNPPNLPEGRSDADRRDGTAGRLSDDPPYGAALEPRTSYFRALLNKRFIAPIR